MNGGNPVKDNNTQFKLFELKPRHVLYIFFILMNILLSMAISYLFSDVIDKISGNSSFTEILHLLLFLLTLVVLNSVLSVYFTNYKPLEVDLEESIGNSRKLLKLLLKSSQKEYEKKEKGYFINLNTSSGFVCADIYSQFSIELIGYILSALIIIIGVSFIYPMFGLIFILYIPIFYFVIRYPSKTISELQKDGLYKQDAYMGEIKKIVEDKRAININYADSYFLNHYHKISDAYLGFIEKFKFFETLTNNFPGIMSNISQILILIISAYLCFEGKLSVGKILFMYQMTSLYQTPLNKCFEIWIHYNVNTSHVERVRTFEQDSNRPSGFEEKYANQSLLTSIHHGKFYATPSKERLLFSVDEFSLPKTGVTLIKGQNGTGKSVLLNYMTGYFDVNCFEGDIQLDTSLSEASYLTYPTLLVNGNLQENMLDKKMDKEVFEMLNISFKDKEIDENVRNLSFGEQQKVNLLRVLSSKKKVVILDEPFTNLDKETIHNLVNYIDKYKSEKAFIIVCHSNELDSMSQSIYQIENQHLNKI